VTGDSAFNVTDFGGCPELLVTIAAIGHHGIAPSLQAIVLALRISSTHAG
jgi:hypothetical protein